MKNLSKILLALLLSGASLGAGATVIDFESAASSGMSNAMPFIEAGYQLTSSLGNAMYHNDVFAPLAGMNTNGSSVMGWCASECGGAKTITLAGSALFSLVSIDFASLIAGTGSGRLQLTGYRQGGATVSQSLSYSDNWATTVLTGFDQLSRVEIFSADGVDVAMDKLVLAPAAVPEPAPYLLAASGLVAALVARRRGRRH